MTLIVDTITKKIGEAMKAKDEIRLSTLRMLSSALNYEFIAKQHKLDKEEELAVVRREIKMRKDAIEAYEKAGAKDRVEKETAEMKILEEYLPVQMTDEELEKLVDGVIAQSQASVVRDMGQVIGLVMGQAKGMADGVRVALLVKQKLAVK